MQNKHISKISKVYAQSLLDTVGENYSSIKEQFAQVLETIKSSNDLQIVMKNSSISISQKIEIINSIFETKIDKLLLSFLKILIEKERFNEIESIYQYYAILLENRQGQKNVKIISAIEIDEIYKNRIIETLENKLKQKIIPNWEIDSNIIAGLIFKFDDYVIDSSVISKIKSLSKIKGNL